MGGVGGVPAASVGLTAKVVEVWKIMMLTILFEALPLVWSCSSVLQTGFPNFKCRVVFGSARP